jgi:hypothetical protein
MIRNLIGKLDKMRRRRRIAKLRRSFAHHGHPVDDVDDATLETVLTRDKGVAAPLAARSIYFALRRLGSEADAIRTASPRQ